MEEWRPVVGYEGYLEVSISGKIRTLKRTYTGRNGSVKTVKPKILSVQADGKGYLRCRTSIDKRKVTIKVHRAVAQAFLDNPDNKPQVDHIDGNKKNNTVENLRWATNKENYDFSVKNGLRENSFKALSECRETEKWKQKARETCKRNFSKQVNCYTRSGEYIRTYESGQEAAREVGGSQSGISGCCTGRLPTYKGYVWRYVE